MLITDIGNDSFVDFLSFLQLEVTHVPGSCNLLSLKVVLRNFFHQNVKVFSIVPICVLFLECPTDVNLFMVLNKGSSILLSHIVCLAQNIDKVILVVSQFPEMDRQLDQTMCQQQNED